VLQSGIFYGILIKDTDSGLKPSGFIVILFYYKHNA